MKEESHVIQLCTNQVYKYFLTSGYPYDMSVNKVWGENPEGPDLIPRCSPSLHKDLYIIFGISELVNCCHEGVPRKRCYSSSE